MAGRSSFVVDVVVAAQDVVGMHLVVPGIEDIHTLAVGVVVEAVCTGVYVRGFVMKLPRLANWTEVCDIPKPGTAVAAYGQLP